VQQRGADWRRAVSGGAGLNNLKELERQSTVPLETHAPLEIHALSAKNERAVPSGTAAVPARAGPRRRIPAATRRGARGAPAPPGPAAASGGTPLLERRRLFRGRPQRARAAARLAARRAGRAPLARPARPRLVRRGRGRGARGHGGRPHRRVAGPRWRCERSLRMVAYPRMRLRAGGPRRPVGGLSGGDGGEERGGRVHEGHLGILRRLQVCVFWGGDLNAAALHERPEAVLACGDQVAIEAAGDEQRGFGSRS
jgi:hypothetical protein